MDSAVCIALCGYRETYLRDVFELAGWLGGVDRCRRVRMVECRDGRV